MLPNKLRTNAGDASACCSSASMSADVKIAHSLDVAKRVAHERRRRVSVLLLSIGLLGWFSSLLYLMLDIYAKLPRNAPSAFFVLTALPPSVALCVLAILPSDRRLTYLAMSLSRFMCALFGVFFAAAGPLFAAEHISWSELSPNAAATFCTGYSLTCIGTAAALAHLLRPQASAPSTCSRAWFALIQEQRTAVRQELDSRSFWALHAIGVGLVPAFWLCRAEYFAVQRDHDALRSFWNYFRAFWLAGGLTNVATILVLYSTAKHRSIYMLQGVGLGLWATSALLIVGLARGVRQLFRGWLLALAAPDVSSSATAADEIKTLMSTTAAATIAALISSDGKPKQALAEAAKRFRVLDIQDLRATDLSENTTLTDASGLSLRERTQSARLGSCDAFLSRECIHVLQSAPSLASPPE